MTSTQSLIPFPENSVQPMVVGIVSAIYKCLTKQGADGLNTDILIAFGI